MIKNIWSQITFVCGNHKHPVEMYVYEGAATPFYACPRYMLKDEEHPNGHNEGEPGCSNRMSFDAARYFVEKISKAMEEDILNNAIADMTGMKMSWHGIDAEITSHDTGKIIVAIKNLKQIDNWSGYENK